MIFLQSLAFEPGLQSVIFFFFETFFLDVFLSFFSDFFSSLLEEVLDVFWDVFFSFLALLFLTSELFLSDFFLFEVFFASSLDLDFFIDLADALFSDLAFESDLVDDLEDALLVLDFIEVEFLEVLLFFEPLRQCALTDTLSLRTKDFTQLQPVVQADCERPLHSLVLA